MFTITAAQLVQLTSTLEDFGHDSEDFDIRTDYSGRGMYGNACLGIVSHDSGLTTALSFELAALLTEDQDFDDLRQNFHEIASIQQTDSMGRGTIVYWPGIQVDTTTD
jgi:hypothetical protein